MDEFWKNNIAVIISGIITIAGFIITIIVTNKNLKNEINKIKISKSMEKMQDIPKLLLDFIKVAQDFDKNRITQEQAQEYLKNINNIIVAYGSQDAIKILENQQSLLYSNKIKGLDIVYYISLLITQIKYDLTGIVMSPLSWLKVNINDYSHIESRAIEKINQIIYENKLNNKFKCKTKTVETAE
ncbi:MAG TPA: hypothetical protein P5087_01940 [Eubacteriales bacterium]|nr:hypothetical protein [Eubacteriales bacterium]